MTRRRFFAPPPAFAQDQLSLTLSGDEARHARNVLRLRKGDEVFVFDGEGKEYRCILREFVRDGAILDLVEQVDAASPESSLDLTLAIALLKGEKFELVIQKCIELGVTRIVPLATERTDVRLGQIEAGKRLTRWRRIALEAAKQCGRARVPDIQALSALDVFIGSVKQADAKLFFAERDGAPLTNMPSVVRRVVAIVGPEGGWSDEEIEQAQKAGWRLVTLGGRTLRAETAAITVVSLLQHRFGDLK